MDQEEKSLMDEDKSFLDIAKELDEEDALKDELLSVEKKDKKVIINIEKGLTDDKCYAILNKH